MSVIVIVKLKGDKVAFEKLIAERGQEMKEISTRGQAAGAIHHRFGANADGTIVIVDEWNNAESFQKFFSDPEIAELMKGSGVEGAPEFLIVDALDTPDQF
jgi:hypothetical protein